MDDYEKMLENLAPQLKNELKSLNKRQNRLINKIGNIIRMIKKNNFYEPYKLGIALDNINGYFEQLRSIDNEMHDIMQALIKRMQRMESEKAAEQPPETKGDSKGSKSTGNLFSKNYEYYNRALPKLSKFRTKNKRK